MEKKYKADVYFYGFPRTFSVNAESEEGARKKILEKIEKFIRDGFKEFCELCSIAWTQEAEDRRVIENINKFGEIVFKPL